MYLNLYLLDIFVAVVEEGSFKKAGERFTLSPSAVSSYMQRLEKSLGKSLFKQTKGEILLTKDGMIVMEYALQFRNLQNQLHALISDSDGKREIIKVGGGLISGSFLLPRLLSSYQQNDSDVNFSVHVSSSLEILEAISEKKLDIGIVIGGKLPPDIQYYSIYKDRYKLVATPQFLEQLPEPIQLDHIKDAPLIFPLINAPRAIQLQLAHIGQKLNMVSTIDIIHPIAAKEFVKTGHYAGCLLQSTIAEELKQGVLQEIILNEMDWPEEEVEYYVIWKGALSDKVRQFLNFVMEYEFN